MNQGEEKDTKSEKYVRGGVLDKLEVIRLRNLRTLVLLVNILYVLRYCRYGYSAIKINFAAYSA